jgi:hypothetical protein
VFVKHTKTKTCSKACGFVFRQRGHEERGRPWLASMQYPARDLENNQAWRGVEASYSSKHRRVYNHRGKPDHCSRCGRTDPHRYEWANLTGDYDDINDYAMMCKPCHRAFDQERGLHPVGELLSFAKLTADIVRQTRTRHAAGETYAALAREFGVTPGALRNAAVGINWKHVA